jgi:uroporphyrinogen-III synthase
VDVATFMSPSAVEHFVKLLDGDLLEVARTNLIVAAIGEPTAEAVRKGGLSQPIVAGTATSQGIIEALMSWENSAQAGR